MKGNKKNSAEKIQNPTSSLTVGSRILVAFAAGALVSVFFLPVWRIDLFAPQYPEGLSMYIWINNITGNVDIINGLNHYIGMKHINVAMFPEFKFLPYVVGFFILSGISIAITGKRKFLSYYLILTVIGGAAAILDFYKWGYNYGHNLNPDAPIQVPGLSYQPPLFGHKRLLNFDAYSFPDVAGWIVVAAAALAFAVWFAEWYHQRKQNKKPSKEAALKKASLATSLLIFLLSCSTKPQPIVYGRDVCDGCKMGMADPRFGGEIITKKGKVYKFDDMHCLVHYLKSGALDTNVIKGKVVVDYNKQNQFIDVAAASFVVSPELKSPMGSNAAGFASKEAAKKINEEKKGELITWNELFNSIN